MLIKAVGCVDKIQEYEGFTFPHTFQTEMIRNDHFQSSSIVSDRTFFIPIDQLNFKSAWNFSDQFLSISKHFNWKHLDTSNLIPSVYNHIQTYHY